MKRILMTCAALLCLFSDDIAMAASPEEMTHQFERGIECLRQRKAEIFAAQNVTITYDVKRTDSLIQPVVGVVQVVCALSGSGREGYVANTSDIRFGFQDGAWIISAFTFTPNFNITVPVPLKPGDRLWNAVQACFTRQ